LVSRNVSKKTIADEHEKDIREAIYLIPSTGKGERLMWPDFGCGIHDYVFTTLNTANIGLIESNVSDSLVMRETRIELLNVNVSTDKASIGELDISIDYCVRYTNNRLRRNTNSNGVMVQAVVLEVVYSDGRNSHRKNGS